MIGDEAKCFQKKAKAMTKRIVVLSVGFLLLLTGLVSAQVKLRVGYVNMNMAINESNEGKRSKKFLEAQFAQSKQTLDLKRQEIQVKEKELNESLMLNEAAKAQKREEIEAMKKQLMDEAKREQNTFRKDEARHTKKIFEDLVSVVEKVAKLENYDLVLEFNIKQTILYSRHEMNDITEKVIFEYNKLQSIE